MDCELCNEPIERPEDRSPVVPLVAHHECNLREVLGGIGHHIAHEYWCIERHDPDAGLTYHQSAYLVVEYYKRVIGYQTDLPPSQDEQDGVVAE